MGQKLDSVLPISVGIRDLGRFSPWAYFAVLLVGFLSFGLSLRGDFYMDDFLHIVGNDHVMEGTWWSVRLRQIPFAIYALSYWAAGYQPELFHFWNLAVHLAIAALVLPLGREFFSAMGWLRDLAERKRAAMFGALVFACHPLNSEAVNYTRCTMIALVSAFSIVAALCFLKGWRRGKEGKRYFLWAAAAAAGATFSKQPGIFHVALTLSLLAAALLPWRNLASWRPRDETLLACAAGFAVACALFRPTIQHFLSLAFSPLLSGSYEPHVLTQGRMFWIYLAKMFVPLGLCSDHRPLQTISAADLPALWQTAGVALSVILVGAGMATRRFRAPATVAALVAGHLLLRFLYPNREAFVEYRVYPSMPWFALAAGVGVAVLHRHRRKFGIYALMAILVAGVPLSAYRSAHWNDSSAIARDALDRYPLNNRARIALMRNAYLAGQYQDVVELHKGVVRCQDTTLALNQKLEPTGRHYLPYNVWQNRMRAEQIYAYALVELKGAQFALKYADATLAWIRSTRAHAKDHQLAHATFEADLADARDNIATYVREQEADGDDPVR